MQAPRVKPERFDPTYLHPAHMAPHINSHLHQPRAPHPPNRPPVQQPPAPKPPVPKPTPPVQEQENIESLPDFSSIKGIFGWTTIDGVNVPYIFRHDKKFVSVRIVEMKLLSRYPNSYPDDLGKHQPLKSFFVTTNEAKLLNEINLVHCGAEYGQKQFTQKDLIVLLTDFIDFYGLVKKTFPENVLSTLQAKKEQVQENLVGSCGWVQLNNTVSPYVKRLDGKYVPLSVVKYAAGLLTSAPVSGSLPTKTECELLNQACKIAGFQFSFAETTRLISFAEVVRETSAVVTELPLDNPLQHAHYMELPNTNSVNSRSMDLRIQPPTDSSNGLVASRADARQMPGNQHPAGYRDMPAGYPYPHSGHPGHQARPDNMTVRAQLQEKQRQMTQDAAKMGGKARYQPPFNGYAEPRFSGVQQYGGNKYPGANPYMNSMQPASHGYYPGRSGPPNVSVQAQPARPSNQAMMNPMAHPYYMGMPQGVKSNAVPQMPASRNYPQQNVNQPPSAPSAAAFYEQIKRSPVRNSPSLSPRRDSRPPSSGSRPSSGIQMSPGPSSPISPRTMFGPHGPVSSMVPSPETLQPSVPPQNPLVTQRLPGTNFPQDYPTSGPNHALQSLAHMLPPSHPPPQSQGGRTPTAQYPLNTAAPASATAHLRNNTFSPRQQSPQAPKEAAPVLFSPPRTPVVQTPEPQSPTRPAPPMAGPPPLLMMAPIVVGTNNTSAGTTPQPDIVQSNQPMPHVSVVPDVQTVTPQSPVERAATDGTIKGAWLNGKSISCLHLDQPERKGRFCLVEAVCKLYFNGCSVHEFLFALDNVLGVPLLTCNDQEERAFIQYYSLPVTVLKCNKMINFDDLEKYFPQLSYMFPDKTQEVVGSPGGVTGSKPGLDESSEALGHSSQTVTSPNIGEKRAGDLSSGGPSPKQPKLIEATVHSIVGTQGIGSGEDGPAVIVLD